MKVRDIALGVFIGNVLFGIVAWIVFGFAAESVRTDTLSSQINSDYSAMQARQQADDMADQLQENANAGR